MIVGSIMGVIASILLFGTMNILYFEKFRREIFIKRLIVVATHNPRVWEMADEIVDLDKI